MLDDTNENFTHCISTHLTEFAGGFITLPPAIDFAYVFAHASFDQNPTIYCTIIVTLGLFVLIW